MKNICVRKESVKCSFFLVEKRNVKTCKKGSNMPAHAWSNNHSIDLDNASVIDKGNFRVRKTLESEL